MELNQLFSVNKNNYYFLVVIDPINFDMKDLRVKFEEFSFVFCLKLEALREHVVTYCQKLYTLRKNRGYDASSLLDFKKRMKKILSPSGISKDETYLFDLVYLFIGIAYYTATSREKNVHSRKFFIFHGTQMFYYYYMSSRDINLSTLPTKVEERLTWLKNRSGDCSFITNVSII